MKRILYIVVVCCALWGCAGEESGTSAKLELNVASIQFCEPSSVFNNLQIRNSGKGPMTIRGIWMRGDEACSFSCDYAIPGNSGRVMTCPNEGSGGTSIRLDAGHTLLVRLEYTASGGTEMDSGAVVIESDAANLLEGDETSALSVVPLCGNAGSDGDFSSDAGESDGGESDGGVTPPSCGSCDTVPEKGAPACASRD